MYARVATFEGADSERAREEGQRRLDSGQTPPGMKGYLYLADPDSRRGVFITFFDRREDIEAAESAFEQMGDEIPEDVRGRRTSRDYYEVLGSQIPALV